MSLSSGSASMDQLCELINRYHDAVYETDDVREKSDALNHLKGYMEEYLNRVPHSQKFQNAVVERVLTQSFFSSCIDYDPRRASSAFESLAKYGQNLLEEPWRKDFETINVLSGYFIHNIRPYLQHPDEILLLMNYVPIDDYTLKLVSVPTCSELKQVVKDCLLASQECLILNKTLEFIQNVMNRDVLTAAEIYQYRRESIGDYLEIGQKIYTNLKKRLHEESIKLQVMQQDCAEKQGNKMDENLDLINADDAMTGIKIYDISPEKEKAIAQEVLKNTQKQFEQQQQTFHQGGKKDDTTQTDTESTLSSQLLKKKEEDLYQQYFSQNSAYSSKSPSHPSSSSAYFPKSTDRENKSLENTTTSHYSDTIGTNTSFDTHQSALQKRKVSQEECQGILMDYEKSETIQKFTESTNKSMFEPNTSSSGGAQHNIDNSQEIEKNSFNSESQPAEPYQNKEYFDPQKKYMSLNLPTTHSSIAHSHQYGGSSTLGRNKSSERSSYFSSPLDLDTTNSSGLYTTEYQRQYSQLSYAASKNPKSDSSSVSEFNELYQKNLFAQQQQNKENDNYLKYKNSENHSSANEKILVATTAAAGTTNDNVDNFSKEINLGGDTAELFYWDCPHCTFRNHNIDKFCEMCLNHKEVSPDVYNNTSTSTTTKPVSSSPKLFLSTQSISNFEDNNNMLSSSKFGSQGKSYSSVVKGLTSPKPSKSAVETDANMKDMQEKQDELDNSNDKNKVPCPFCTFLNPKFRSFCGCCARPIHISE